MRTFLTVAKGVTVTNFSNSKTLLSDLCNKKFTMKIIKAIEIDAKQN